MSKPLAEKAGIEDRVISRMDEATLVSVPDGADLRSFVHDIQREALSAAYDFAFEAKPPSSKSDFWGYAEAVGIGDVVVYVAHNWREDGEWHRESAYVRSTWALNGESVEISSPELVEPEFEFTFVSVGQVTEEAAPKPEDDGMSFSTEGLSPAVERVMRARKFGWTTDELRGLFESPTDETREQLRLLAKEAINQSRVALADQGQNGIPVAASVLSTLTGKKIAETKWVAELATDLSFVNRGKLELVQSRVEAAGLR
ncbi:MAG: hypothetical protein GY871_04430 [Actinomycetales bacterium]|nr:hypothetical protein [Actinomycetales bacterium]